MSPTGQVRGRKRRTVLRRAVTVRAPERRVRVACQRWRWWRRRRVRVVVRRSGRPSSRAARRETVERRQSIATVGPRLLGRSGIVDAGLAVAVGVSPCRSSLWSQRRRWHGRVLDRDELGKHLAQLPGGDLARRPEVGRPFPCKHASRRHHQFYVQPKLSSLAVPDTHRGACDAAPAKPASSRPPR